MLEEDFFRNRTADFFYMFLVGGALMTLLAYFVNLLFLGHAFTIMLVYIWSRRNPGLRMNFFGLITFQAPYLPWVLLAFTILLGSSTVVDIIGIIVGHFYYFFEDVFPNEPHGFRVLETPAFIKYVFTRLGIDEPPLNEEDRPEQFNFADGPEGAQQVNDPTNREPSSTDDDPQTNASNNEPSPTTTDEVNRGSRSTTSDTTDDLDNELRARNVQNRSSD